MTRPEAWGIFREHAHSPGRESDDAEILRLTAKALETRGFAVSLKDPTEIVGAEDPGPSALFMMCEGLEVLRIVTRWTATGTRAVNPPGAVLATYRERMLTLWTRSAIPIPESRAVSTDDPPARETVRSGRPVWVKRGDVHNVAEGDVVLADRPERVREALSGLARRGIRRAIIQEHVEGDLIKFYGIGRPPGTGVTPSWFRHFYHADQVIRGHVFDADALAALAWHAADALGLEVFGGDAIVTPRGALLLIDLNAWPSFALYRDEAAPEIAAHLEARFLDPRRSAP
jgi:hypothetical protein